VRAAGRRRAARILRRGPGPSQPCRGQRRHRRLWDHRHDSAPRSGRV